MSNIQEDRTLRECKFITPAARCVPAGGRDTICFSECPGYVDETVEVPERHPLSARFHEVLASVGAMHDRKSKDYGRDEDPFANVRAATEFGVPAWLGAAIRMNDKMRRLQAYATTGELANEGVEDSFLDLAVYAIIALILFEEEQGE